MRDGPKDALTPLSMTCLSSTVCTTTRARLRGALRSTQPPYPPQVPVTSAANLMPTNLSHINPSTPDVRNASRIAIFEALIISALPVNASFRNVCAAVDICRIVGLVDPDAGFRKGTGRDCRERRGESQVRNFHSENPFIQISAECVAHGFRRHRGRQTPVMRPCIASSPIDTCDRGAIVPAYPADKKRRRKNDCLPRYRKFRR